MYFISKAFWPLAKPEVFRLKVNGQMPQACLLAAHQSDQEQEHQRPDDGRDDVADEAATNGDAEYAKQPAAYEGADDTHDDVAQQAKTVTTANDSGQPARNRANDERKDQVFHNQLFLVMNDE